MFSFSMKIILLALLGAPTVLGHCKSKPSQQRT